MGERLFAVDVPAGPGGRDGQHGMPVVGNGDRDGVDIPAEKEVVEIGVGGTVAVSVFPVDDGPGLGQMILVEVAHRHPLDIVHAQEGFHVGNPHHPEPDTGHNDAVGRGHGARQSEGRGPDDGRETGGAGDGDRQ